MASADDGDRVIEDCGEWDWALVVTADADVVARKAIPHDGVLTYSTRDRPGSPRKRSRFGLSVRQVIEHYAAQADTETPRVQLAEDVARALEAVRGVPDA